MAGKSKSAPRKTAAQAKSGTPIKMVVRRGALKRFENLKKKTAHLQVEVVWDQRDDDRRHERTLTPGERRIRERRRKPPFTWDLADFVVATPANGPDPKKRKPSSD